MKRLEKIKRSLAKCYKEYFCPYAIRDLRWAVKEIERLSAYPKAVDAIKSRYPTDVFPDGNNSVAEFARSVCDHIHETAAEITEDAKGKE